MNLNQINEPFYPTQMMRNVHATHPLVHNITNYVTVNDCANILLAAGASPIMADDIGEVEEIQTICGALVINIGTLNARTIDAMLAAGRTATTLGHPIILDPVGAGASKLRTETAKSLLESLEISVIRGNISELKALYAGDNHTKGVDANDIDAITEDNLIESIALAKRMAQHFESIVAITGAIDIVSDSETAFVIRNGHASMSRITGTGCMLTSLVGAYACANPHKKLHATVTAVALMGICGELAHASCEREKLGSSSMRTRLIDAISMLTPEILEQHLKCEVR